MKDRFIVCEISCSWPRSDTEYMANQPAGYEMPRLLSQRFQDVLNVNDARGFDLVDWRFCTSVRDNPDEKKPTSDIATETIIAVFERRA